MVFGSDEVMEKETNPFLVFLAAAMHDSAREDESEDHWDRESGKNMKHLMERIGFNSLPNKEEFLDYARAISRKETASKKEMSLAAMIVYDADCLEIIRCLSDPSRFVQNHLCINGTLDSEVQSEFIDEVKRFIQMTESLSFKTDFENSTQKPISDLLSFLSAHSEEFPFSKPHSFRRNKEYMIKMNIRFVTESYHLIFFLCQGLLKPIMYTITAIALSALMLYGAYQVVSRMQSRIWQKQTEPAIVYNHQPRRMIQKIRMR